MLLNQQLKIIDLKKDKNKMEHIVKILKIDFVTHDTKSFIVEKPKNYKFVSGQATTMAINKPGLEKEKRPVTFSSTNENLVLELIIKKYPGGITEKIHELSPGDELIITDPFGVMHYKGEGIFFAGGAGITPFLSIFRSLKNQNKINKNMLIFSNKTAEDIINEKELANMLGKNLILILTKEKKQGYESKRIDEQFIKDKIKAFNKQFYICGPREFVSSIKEILQKLGAKKESILIEG